MTGRRPAPERRKATAFRIVAAVLGLAIILLVLPFTLISLVSGDPEETIHRFHLTAGAISSLVLAAALLILARRAFDIAQLQLLAVAAVVSLIAGLLGGDLISGLYFIPAVATAILLVLHPAKRDVWQARRVRVVLLALAVIALVPLVAYALTQSGLQREALSGDPHAEMHHYSGIALTALALPATVFVAAVADAGWRIVGWMAAIAFLLFGVFTLLFADYVSAPAIGWGWARLAAGLAVLGATELEAARGG